MYYCFIVLFIGNSDDSFMSAVISMPLSVPNFRVSRKAFTKQQVNWNTIFGAILELPWRNILCADKLRY